MKSHVLTLASSVLLALGGVAMSGGAVFAQDAGADAPAAAPAPENDAEGTAPLPQGNAPENVPGTGEPGDLEQTPGTDDGAPDAVPGSDAGQPDAAPLPENDTGEGDW